MGVNPFVDEATFYAFPKVLFFVISCGDCLIAIVLISDLWSALDIQNSSTLRGHTFVATPSWFLTSETVEEDTWFGSGTGTWPNTLWSHPSIPPISLDLAVQPCWYTYSFLIHMSMNKNKKSHPNSLLSDETFTLKQQTGAFDRLADDTRLYAHKLGQANPDQRVRLELYRDMVHVHQFFEFLPMADKALYTMAEFIYDSQDKYRNSINNGSGAGKKGARGETEWIVMETDGTEWEGHHDEGCPISVLEDCWNPEMREKAAANA